MILTCLSKSNCLQRLEIPELTSVRYLLQSDTSIDNSSYRIITKVKRYMARNQHEHFQMNRETYARPLHHQSPSQFKSIAKALKMIFLWFFHQNWSEINEWILDRDLRV